MSSRNFVWWVLDRCVRR